MKSCMLIRYTWRDQAEISFDSSLAMGGDGNGRGAIGEGGEGGEGEATDDALDALDTALLPRTGRRLERKGAIKTIESAAAREERAPQGKVGRRGKHLHAREERAPQGEHAGVTREHAAHKIASDDP